MNFNEPRMRNGEQKIMNTPARTPEQQAAWDAYCEATRASIAALPPWQGKSITEPVKRDATYAQLRKQGYSHAEAHDESVDG